MKSLLSKLSWESVIVIFVVLLALFFAKYPSIHNLITTPSGYWFVGHASWFDGWDVQVYLSAIRYGEYYGVFLQNPFTTVPHDGVFIYQFYTILGVLNRLLHTSPMLLFHISSVITSIIFIVAIYIVVKHFFQDKLVRLSAFTTAVLGGGFGWIEAFRSAADLQSAGLTTVNAFERGHDAFSTACFLLSFIFFIKFAKNGNKSLLIWAIVLGLLNCIIHPPFIVMYITAVSFISLLMYLRLKNMHLFLYPLSIALIFALYYLLFLSGMKDNIGFHGIVSQELDPVAFGSLLLGLGIVVPFLVLCIIRFKKNNFDILLIKIIFVVQFAFLYIPTGFNLYFLKGLFIWAVILAFYELQKSFRTKYLLVSVIGIVLVISLLTRIWTFNALMNADKRNTYIFLKEAEGSMLQSIGQFPSGNMLSLLSIGNYIPAYSNHKVFLGHAHQTPYSKPRLRNALLFYAFMSKQERQDFIRVNDITYIYYGLEEAEWRKDNKLSTQNPFPEYKIVYQKEGIIIYKIQ